MDKKVNDLEVARPLVNWAYKAEAKDVSPVLKFGNKYVVAVVDKVREEGFADINDIRADIENRVRQQKKSEQIMAAMEAKKSGVKSIEELGKALGLQVQPVSGLRFIASALGSAGVEPNVIAAATALEKGLVSIPLPVKTGCMYWLSPALRTRQKKINQIPTLPGIT
jgi:peptidyl-prolyl cis-trans isomerase D